jgi:hypothetical protein
MAAQEGPSALPPPDPERPREDRLSMQVGEGRFGWFWIVYSGEGDEPGTALGAAGAYHSPEQAFEAGLGCLRRCARDR